MAINYINEEELVKFNNDVSETGLKKSALAELIGFSCTYFSLILSGKKKLRKDKLRNIDFILNKYILLHKEFSSGDKKDDSRGRIDEKYKGSIEVLDNISEFTELGLLTMSVEDEYLRNKLNKAIDFGLDSNMDIKSLSEALKNIFYCYG